MTSSNKSTSKTPGERLAKSVVVMGMFMNVLALLASLTAIPALLRAGTAVEKLVMLFVLAVFLVPGVSLVCLAPGLRRGSHAAAIATLVICCVVFALMFLSFVGQMMQVSRSQPPNFVGLLITLIIGSASAALAIGAVGMMRNKRETIRGFEPMYVAPRTPATSADGSLSEATAPSDEV